MKRRIISILMALCIIFSFALPSSAANDINVLEAFYSISNINERFQDITKSWNENNYKGQALVDEVIPVINAYEQIIGVSVSFVVDKAPAGYMVLSLIDKSPLVTFNTNGSDIYSTMSEAIGIGKVDLKAKRLFSDTMVEFAVEYRQDDKDMIVTESGQHLLKEDYIKTSKERTDKLNQLSKERHLDGYIDNLEKCIKKINNEMLSGGTTNFFDAFLNTVPNWDYTTAVDVNGTSEFTPLEMSSRPNYLSSTQTLGTSTAGAYNEQNCGPTAFTNLIKFYKEKKSKTSIYYNGSLNDTYLRLANLSHYNCSSGVNQSYVVSTFDTYIGERGYSGSAGAFWYSYWTDFTGNINNGKPVILLVNGYDSTNTYVGHYVVVFGYCNDTNNSKFLKIANGWDATTSRYIKFKPSELDNFDGYGITIT